MFTGLVQGTAEVLEIRTEGSGKVFRIARPDFFPISEKISAQTPSVAMGDSICVSGCCLTVTAFDDTFLEFEAGSETLSKTKLGSLGQGSRVNLEESMKLGDKVGGHLVTGHVDGQGQIDDIQEDGQWKTFWITAPISLLRQMAGKGSVTVDGVSLTLVDVSNQKFSLALIPHTLQETTLGTLKVGDFVNLETDVLAKYVARQLEFLNLEPGKN